MTEEQWKEFEFFSPSDNWGNPQLIDYSLVKELEGLRKFIGTAIRIHCATQGVHAPKSYHYAIPCVAVDCSTKGISLVNFYLGAERFGFTGIGIYTWWKKPGLHIDRRPIPAGESKARWASVEEGKYIALDEKFLKGLLSTTPP